MTDNIFTTAVFALIFAVAVAVAVQIVRNEEKLATATALAQSGPTTALAPTDSTTAAASSVATAADTLTLPTVTVNGRRQPLESRLASRGHSPTSAARKGDAS